MGEMIFHSFFDESDFITHSNRKNKLTKKTLKLSTGTTRTSVLIISHINFVILT